MCATKPALDSLVMLVKETCYGMLRAGKERRGGGVSRATDAKLALKKHDLLLWSQQGLMSRTKWVMEGCPTGVLGNNTCRTVPYPTPPHNDRVQHRDHQCMYLCEHHRTSTSWLEYMIVYSEAGIIYYKQGVPKLWEKI